MNITFCLPSMLKYQCGGFKIIFEYANRLIEKGHNINIVFLTDRHYKKYIKNNKINKTVANFFVKNYPTWFNLDKKINKIATPYLDGRDFPNADIIIATAIETALCVANCPDNKGKKYYFIQGFENWNFNDEQVIESYNLRMTNITIAHWLTDIVENKANSKAITVSNPIDINKFYITKDIKSRNPYEIAMLYHEGKHKGCEIAFLALEIVKKKYPNLHLNLFGVYDFQKSLHAKKEWITYTRKANDSQLLDIYNSSAIFVCASINEGFGLTGAESMACGCALASTDYLGVFEYAQHNHNALLSPVNNVEQLANNISSLIDNNELRWRLAQNGNLEISKLSWDSQVLKLENIFKGIIQ